MKTGLTGHQQSKQLSFSLFHWRYLMFAETGSVGGKSDKSKVAGIIGSWMIPGSVESKKA
jgi:hypothetical protein